MTGISVLPTVTVSASRLPSGKSANSYSSKLLRATLILPTANFPGTSSNTLTLVGYRMSATIQGAARLPTSLDLTIYGMRQADMNQVTILYSAATPQQVSTRALVILEASPDGSAWTQVFNGTFIQAQPDYRSVPHVALRAQAVTGNGMQLAIAPATSYRGATSIASIAQYLAGQMGFAFENNGVTGNLSTPYYPGTYMDQFRQLAQHANFDFYFDGNATLAICPINTPRNGKTVPIFTPTSGLVGFPTIQQFGIHCETIFTPALILGGEIKIDGSIVPGANGTWQPAIATHELESLMPSGAWFSSLDCLRSTA
jgi:hypothetical protein